LPFEAIALTGLYSFFWHDLLQDMPIPWEIRNQPLELAVLLAQLPQQARATKLKLPADL
jgi:hypothetical protein